MAEHPDGAAGHAAAVPYYAEPGRRRGILGWITSTDHKRIGILYLVSVLTFFSTAVTLGVLMRIELASPGPTIMRPQTYNALFTLHGIIQIFLVVIPAIPTILGNFFLPILIGTRDMAFPRLNLFSWYLYITGAVLVFVSVFISGGPIDTGWTFYVPYSLRTTVDVPLAVFAVFILGMSSILTGINIVTTVHQLRAPGMSFFRLPLSVWGLYSTAWVQILATPVIGITLVLIIAERLVGVGVFDPAKGGDPLLYQHLFWIYSHPAVYIMILPGMGIMSEVITTFSRRHIFGYRFIAFSSLAIAVFGFLVWGHHMFVSGQSEVATMIFSFLTFFVAIPSAIKIFNWTATMYKGSIALDTPMLYALSFLFLFSIGGLTGIFLGALSVDVHMHDTYFVVAHFHYVMMGGTVMAFLSGLHYWWPKMTGRMYPEVIARITAAVIFVGFNVTFLTQFVLGSKGMPRRYYDYLEQYQPLHQFSTFGSWILGAGFLIMAGYLAYSLKNGAKAPDNPWGSLGLEWRTPSPPPLENFVTLPDLSIGPYDYYQVYGEPAEPAETT
jgi:cytochrome c oxidase subunit 1